MFRCSYLLSNCLSLAQYAQQRGVNFSANTLQTCHKFLYDYQHWLHLILFQRKCGVIVYDDLNHPHMVEADQEILTQYSMTPTMTTMKNRNRGLKDYQAGTLSTFSLGSPPGIRSPPGSVLGIRSPLPDTPGIHQVKCFSKKLSLLLSSLSSS